MLWRHAVVLMTQGLYCICMYLGKMYEPLIDETTDLITAEEDYLPMICEGTETDEVESGDAYR